MPILAKTVRFAAITVAVLVLGLSLFGMFGVWWIDHRATEVALKGFGLVETAVGMVNAGTTRVDDLIAMSRTEVRQAAETITTVGTLPQANRPVLDALSERLETRLAPRIAQMQEALAPVRDAVGTIGNVVSLVSSLPMIADRAPRLAALDESFNRIEGLSADTAQLRSTLLALVTTQTGVPSAETVATLSGLTQRIDARLGEVQANVQGVRGEITAWQVRLEARKARVLFVFNVLALLVTLMFVWILYSQFVVIRHHWTRVRGSATEPATGPQ